MAIRAVLFDIGDTLWHSAEAPPAAVFRRLAATRATTFLDSAGIQHSDPAKIARVAWDALENAMRVARSTDRIEPDYAAVARKALSRMGLELTHAHAAALIEAIYVSGEDGGKTAYAGVSETLDELRARGFLLGIVTNRAFGGARFRQDLRIAGISNAWDATVVSVEVGYLKPHPAIFEAAFKALAVRPEEAVMVGNSLLEDVSGAQALGLRAAWKRSEPDAEGVLPDFAFDEVPELLEWDALVSAATRGASQSQGRTHIGAGE